MMTPFHKARARMTPRLWTELWRWLPSETEDQRDVRIARRRLAEIEDDPDKLVSGENLEPRLRRLEGQ